MRFRAEELQKFVKKEKYQIFILSSRLPFPFSFVEHSWIALKEPKKRVEEFLVWQFRSKRKGDWDYLRKRTWCTFGGVWRILGFTSLGINKTRLLGIIEGDKDSLAEEFVNKAKKEIPNYPYSQVYHFVPGPNSNTFTQWVLDLVPGHDLELPWNAFGKGYKKR